MTYWVERGRTFEAEAVSKGWDRAQEPALTEMLSGLRFESVLDVGCGFGRVGEGILESRPWVRYTGMDVSPDLVLSAQRRLPGHEIVLADLVTWDDERTWDLVLAVSVLSHVRPESIEGVVAKLWQASRRDFVVLDWDNVGAETPYQWGHDFGSLFASDLHCSQRLGALSMWHLE